MEFYESIRAPLCSLKCRALHSNVLVVSKKVTLQSLVDCAFGIASHCRGVGWKMKPLRANMRPNHITNMKVYYEGSKYLQSCLSLIQAL